jgi:hypothetical protein
MRDSSHLRGSERELFSQTRRKSAAGYSAKPKQEAGRLFFQSRWFSARRGDFNARKDSIARVIFCRRKDSVNPPDFLQAQGFCKSA